MRSVSVECVSLQTLGYVESVGCDSKRAAASQHAARTAFVQHEEGAARLAHQREDDPARAEEGEHGADGRGALKPDDLPVGQRSAHHRCIQLNRFNTRGKNTGPVQPDLNPSSLERLVPLPCDRQVFDDSAAQAQAVETRLDRRLRADGFILPDIV